MAGDVGAVLDQLDPAPADVIGLSLGGCVALALALARPAAVRRLVLVNTFARFQTMPGPSRARAWRRLQLLVTGTSRQLAVFVADGLFPAPDQAAVREAAIDSLAQTPRSVTLRAAWAAACFDVRGKLGRVVAPTLVVSGARDTTVPARCGQELVRGIPGARWWQLPNSGHATPIDQAVVFNERILAFLTGAERSQIVPGGLR
jgi:pimeloyl-ACP methyl ester carboxylesterase